MENERNFTVDKPVEVEAGLLECRLCEISRTKLKQGGPVFLSFVVFILNLVLQ